MKAKKDSEHKDWEPPLLDVENHPETKFVANRCVGKNVTDAVEALTCALYLSTKCLRTVLDWVSHIKLVPLTRAVDMIDKFRYGVDYTLRQYRPLSDFNLEIGDTVRDLFLKYQAVEHVDPPLKQFLLDQMDQRSHEVGCLGDAFLNISDLKGEALISKALNILDHFQD